MTNKRIHELTDEEYGSAANAARDENDHWPWCDGVDSINDFFPFWVPDSLKNEWEKYLLDKFPKYDSYTPDMPELNRQKYHDVFVYGTLKKGGGNAGLLRNTTYIGKAWTKVKCLRLLRTRNNLPVVFFTSSPDGLAVQGELYRCPVETVRTLDELEGNGYLYKRRKIIVETEYGDDFKAFMYFGIKTSYPEEGLTKCNIFTRKSTGRQYYSYTPYYKGP